MFKEIQLVAAAKSGVTKLEADWKKGVLPGLVTLVVTLGSLYSTFGGLIPPRYALPAAIGLSALYLAIEGLLRLHHQAMPAVPGIPAPSLDALVALLEQKYPSLKQYEEPLKEVKAVLETPPAA